MRAKPPETLTRANFILVHLSERSYNILVMVPFTVVQGGPFTLCRADMFVAYQSAMTLLFFREIPVGVITALNERKVKR
ncbi:hypothetical protein OBV_42590 [Oscillibacter valericigenes Sjm18-20]|nr:hypothetical protein OBV_42590 [Oscillibacter valericigenes Sjm18-20]